MNDQQYMEMAKYMPLATIIAASALVLIFLVLLHRLEQIVAELRKLNKSPDTEATRK